MNHENLLQHATQFHHRNDDAQQIRAAVPLQAHRQVAEEMEEETAEGVETAVSDFKECKDQLINIRFELN
jgi:hypothetical protein